MLEAACVLHVADISPNELFLLHLDEMIRQELAEALFKQTAPKNRSAQTKNNIFLISVQSVSPMMRRQKRSAGGGVDILIAVHDPKEKRFIESNHLVQRIHALQANLSKSVGHLLHAYNSLCAQKVTFYFKKLFLTVFEFITSMQYISKISSLLNVSGFELVDFSKFIDNIFQKDDLNEEIKILQETLIHFDVFFENTMSHLKNKRMMKIL